MQLSITGRHIAVTDPIRDYIEKRLGSVVRHLPSLYESRVELANTANSAGQRYVVQVTLRVGARLLRGEERANDLFAAIDAVMEKMTRQVERFKNRLNDRRHRPAISAEPEGELETEEGDFDEALVHPIVRTKHFQTSPMHPEEAIEQMELLGHNFFVFFNAHDGQVNVAYRRQTGDYGLLKPELA